MSDQDKESGTEKEPQPEPNQPQLDLDALAAKIANIQNEDGTPKYTSVDKAVESIQPKEEFIEKLKAEGVEKDAKFEALEKRFNELENKVTIEEQVAKRIADSTGQNEQPSTVNVDEQVLGDLVATQLNKIKTKETREANASKFLQAIAAETDNPENYIAEKAKESGLGTDFFSDLIARNPDAALKLIGSDKKIDPSSTPSNVNTAGFQEKTETNKPTSGLFTTTKKRESDATQVYQEALKKHGLTE